MLTLRFTAGVGVGFSGACGPPLVWRARKPLPCALRSPASLALGLERRRAPVPEHCLAVLGLCLRPHGMSPSLLFSSSLLFLLVRVALKLRSLRFHSPRLCRIAVFSIHTVVSLRIVMNIILGDGTETSLAGPRTVEDLPKKVNLDEDGPGGQHATLVTKVDASAGGHSRSRQERQRNRQCQHR